MSARAVVVTGAASGIGLGITELLAARGELVVGVDVDAEALARADVPGVEWLEGDVAEPDTHEQAADVAERRGRLAGWVNNAGYNILGSVHELDRATVERGMDVNFGGVLWGTATAVRRMLAAGGGGSIVNMSSVHSQIGFRGFAAYAASKGAINALTRQVAAEYAPHGIRANAIAPGVIVTPMNLRELEAQPDPAAAEAFWHTLSPIGRLGRPADVAEAAAFLLSDDAAGFVTGQVLGVDGGLLTLVRGQ